MRLNEAKSYLIEQDAAGIYQQGGELLKKLDDLVKTSQDNAAKSKRDGVAIGVGGATAVIGGGLAVKTLINKLRKRKCLKIQNVEQRLKCLERL